MSSMITKKNCYLMYLLGALICISPVLADWQPLQPENQPWTGEFEVIESDNEHLLAKIDIPGYWSELVTVDGQEFISLSLGEMPSTSFTRPGEPHIPTINGIIYIPDGNFAVANVVESEWQSVTIDNPIIPSQYPHRGDDTPKGPFVVSDAAYESSHTYPNELLRISTPQGWGGTLVSSLSLSPFKYNPAQQLLHVASSITIRIDFVSGDVLTPVKPPAGTLLKHDIFGTNVINPPYADPNRDNDDDDTNLKILVIIDEDAYETAEPLIDWHHNSGQRTEIWYTDDIDNIEDPEDGPRTIKDRVKELYEEEGLEYVFIIGDAYEDSFDVPMWFWDPFEPGEFEDPLPISSYSDSWYVCLDDDVEDDDGNILEDHLAELSVGRIVYDDLDELEIQVNKILNYLNWTFEDNLDGEWLRHSILVAHKEYYAAFGGYHYIQDKIDISEFDYSLPNPEWTLLLGNRNGDNNDDIIDAVNEGVGFFNYRGHGNSYLWGNWNRSNQAFRAGILDGFENESMPFILVSSACLCANVATYRNDCLVESFMKHPGAAVSAHGSIISTYTMGNSYSDRRLFIEFFDRGRYALGKAQEYMTNQLVLHFANDYAPGRGRMNHRAYIWLGDPMLEYRFDPPEQLVTDIPAVMRTGEETLDVHVTRDGEDAENVRICLRDEEDNIYLVSHTDQSGIADFEFEEPLDEIQLTWMATERNSIPASGRIFVAEGIGRVIGQVVEFANESPIVGASVTMSLLNEETSTDIDGNYSFEEVPAGWIYNLTAEAEGFIPETVQVEVDEDEVVTEDFSLKFSTFDVDSLEVFMYMDAEDTVAREIEFSNSGNGILEWSIAIEYPGDEAEFNLLNEINASDVTDDSRLFGVEYYDGNFYVTGGNDNSDPNYIYVIDSDGELQETYEQPAECTSFGMRDLAFDGEYLYGSSNARIQKIDLNGDQVDTLNGMLNPNLAIAVDDSGYIWTANGSENIIALNSMGEVAGIYPNPGHDIRGLAIDDNGSVLLYVREVETSNPILYRYNFEMLQTEYIANLSSNGEDVAGDGLCFITDYIDGYSAVAGMVENDDDRFVRVWLLDGTTEWLSVEPQSGSLDPESSDEFVLTFTSNAFQEHHAFSADLVVSSNGRQPRIVIPVMMEVGFQSVADDKNILPGTFEVSEAFPNPFNAVTTISISLNNAGTVTSQLFDINGRSVREVVKRDMSAGTHSISINGEALSSGVYFLRLKHDNSIISRKIALVR